MANLSPKQRRFVDEYLIDLNATQAYIRAGYASPANVARTCASKLLTKPRIRALLEERRAELAAQTLVSPAWVLEKLRENVERAMQNRPAIINGKPTGQYFYDGAVANTGLQLIGRHLGMFGDGGGVKLRAGAETDAEGNIRTVIEVVYASRPDPTP